MDEVKLLKVKKLDNKKIKTVKKPEEIEVQLPEKHGITKRNFTDIIEVKMLLETDFAHLKDTLSKNAEARFYIVMQHHPKYIRFNQIQECGSLCPPDELLRQYKLGSVTWDGFKKKYSSQLKNPVCQDLIKIIAQESKLHDVYLVSDCDSEDYCYRILLQDAIDHLK
jgi:uncharacterized protein YeaO (DUF488 family)